MFARPGVPYSLRESPLPPWGPEASLACSEAPELLGLPPDQRLLGGPRDSD